MPEHRTTSIVVGALTDEEIRAICSDPDMMINYWSTLHEIIMVEFTRYAKR